MATQDPEAGRLAEQVAALRWRCLHAPADDAPHDDSPAGARTGSTAAASAAAAIIALPPPPLLPPQQPIQREPPSFGEQLFALERRWGALRKLLEAPPDIGVPGIGRGAAASPAGLLRGLLSELFRDVEALWLDAGREPAAYSLMEAVADAAMEFETEAAVAAAARAAGVPAGGGGARGGALETASAFGVARAAALAGADGARRVILSDDLWQQWDTFAARTRAQEILSQELEQAAFAAAAALEASVLDAATDACAPASPMTQATVPLRAAVPAATSHLVSADLPLPLIGAASAAVDTVAGVAVLGAASSQAIAFVGNKQAGSSSACSSSSDFTAAAHAPHAESSAQGRLDDGKAITAAPMSRRQRQREHRRLGQQQQQQSAAAIPDAAAATAAPHTAGQAVTMQQQQQQQQQQPQRPCRHGAKRRRAANAAGAQLEAAARAIAGWRLQGVAKPRARVARGELQRPRDSSLRGTLLRAILRVARAAEVVTAGTIAGAALSHAFLA
ncbi:hypothetical protein MNEG_0006 [Monoraphidium neglectum]|uniref:Uncharacterized protein n=1 Tax=Monoraphidium neglectum TaxID=145388 RepID=A0A0D2KCX1_9CHLO|nr:hypothetical protein MNEG_0006 [Monoraphidium neglectum]KIZ07933.1 hypothetical protein MNEG_0006 [Monoraphidium neglectum]|eukprot:XP_013906952.1 hypothetical protein MNEG_0006 [Monoraphidium neglectum]